MVRFFESQYIVKTHEEPEFVKKLKQYFGNSCSIKNQIDYDDKENVTISVKSGGNAQFKYLLPQYSHPINYVSSSNIDQEILDDIKNTIDSISYHCEKGQEIFIINNFDDKIGDVREYIHELYKSGHHIDKIYYLPSINTIYFTYKNSLCELSDKNIKMASYYWCDFEDGFSHNMDDEVPAEIIEDFEEWNKIKTGSILKNRM